MLRVGVRRLVASVAVAGPPPPGVIVGRVSARLQREPLRLKLLGERVVVGNEAVGRCHAEVLVELVGDDDRA